MRREIKFYRLKMEIPFKSGEVASYFSDLLYVKYDKPFSMFYFTGEKTVLMAEITLKRLLDNLPEKPFFRCSRQIIINICRYRSFTVKPPLVVMEDGTEFKLSYRNITAFKRKKAGLERLSPLCESCYTCKNHSCSDKLIFCNTDSSNKS